MTTYPVLCLLGSQFVGWLELEVDHWLLQRKLQPPEANLHTGGLQLVVYLIFSFLVNHR